MTDYREVSSEMLARRIRDAARRVRLGDEARTERTELIVQAAGREEFEIKDLAELGEVTRQAVEKMIAKSHQNGTTE